MCADAVQVNCTVPTREHAAGLSKINHATVRQCNGGPASADQRTDHKFAAVIAVVERRYLQICEAEQVAAQPVGAAQALLYQFQPQARPQAPDCAFAADDGGKASQRLVGVGEPVAVVGIGDVILADQIGHLVD